MLELVALIPLKITLAMPGLMGFGFGMLLYFSPMWREWLGQWNGLAIDLRPRRWIRNCFPEEILVELWGSRWYFHVSGRGNQRWPCPSKQCQAQRSTESTGQHSIAQLGPEKPGSFRGVPELVPSHGGLHRGAPTPLCLPVVSPRTGWICRETHDLTVKTRVFRWFCLPFQWHLIYPDILYPM